MNDYSKSERLNFYNERKIDGGKIWILFLFLGWSYGSLGSMVKQIFFYLTFGGFGFWVLYVLFTLNTKINKANKKIANEIGFDAEDLKMLGFK